MSKEAVIGVGGWSLLVQPPAHAAISEPSEATAKTRARTPMSFPGKSSRRAQVFGGRGCRSFDRVQLRHRDPRRRGDLAAEKPPGHRSESRRLVGDEAADAARAADRSAAQQARRLQAPRDIFGALLGGVNQYRLLPDRPRDRLLQQRVMR